MNSVYRFVGNVAQRGGYMVVETGDRAALVSRIIFGDRVVEAVGGGYCRARDSFEAKIGIRLGGAVTSALSVALHVDTAFSLATRVVGLVLDQWSCNKAKDGAVKICDGSFFPGNMSLSAYNGQLGSACTQAYRQAAAFCSKARDVGGFFELEDILTNAAIGFNVLWAVMYSFERMGRLEDAVKGRILFMSTLAGVVAKIIHNIALDAVLSDIMSQTKQYVKLTEQDLEGYASIEEAEWGSFQFALMMFLICMNCMILRAKPNKHR